MVRSRLSVSLTFVLWTMGTIAAASAVSAEPWSEAEIARRAQRLGLGEGWLFAHVDATALRPESVQEMRDALGERNPLSKDQVDQIEGHAKALRETLDRAGIEEAVLAVGPFREPVVVQFRRNESGDDAALLAFSESFGFKSFDPTGEMPIFFRGHVVYRTGEEFIPGGFETAELQEAFASIHGSPIRVVAMQSPFVREYYGDYHSFRDQEMQATRKALIEALRFAALGVDPNRKGRVELRVRFGDEATAEEIRGRVERTLESALADRWTQDMLTFMKIGPEKARTAFDLSKPHSEGADVALVRSLDELAVAQTIETFVPGVQKVREFAVTRAVQYEKMKRLIEAFHAYHDDHDRLPPVAAELPNAVEGKRGVSWRVLLLPYLEQQELYERFRLDEPWDSERNRALIQRMPEVYQSVDAAAPAGQTPFVRPLFPGSIASAEKPLSFGEITDGLSNVILIVEATPSRTVAWTKPLDLEIDLAKLGEQFGHPESPTFPVGVVGGSVNSVRKTVDPETFRSLLLPGDGRTFDWSRLNEP